MRFAVTLYPSSQNWPSLSFLMAVGFQHRDSQESNLVFHVNSGYLRQMNPVVLAQFGGKLTGDGCHGNDDSFCYMNYSDGRVLNKHNIFDLS